MTARPNKVHKASTRFLAGVGFVILGTLSVLQSVLTHRSTAWGGLLPILVLGYSVYCFIGWWKALHHPILSPEPKRAFSIGWTGFGAVLVAIGAVVSSGTNGGQSTTGGELILVGLAAVMGYWAIVFGLAWGRSISADIEVASTPAPSTADIALLLEADWGRSPTIVEVAAVHQMLTSRRNEALLATGLSLSALYLTDRSPHHER